MLQVMATVSSGIQLLLPFLTPSAISDQIDGTPERYDKYRQECVSFIEQNRFDFEPFIEDDVPFDTVTNSHSHLLL